MFSKMVEQTKILQRCELYGDLIEEKGDSIYVYVYKDRNGPTPRKEWFSKNIVNKPRCRIIKKQNMDDIDFETIIDALDDPFTESCLDKAYLKSVGYYPNLDIRFKVLKTLLGCKIVYFEDNLYYKYEYAST